MSEGNMPTPDLSIFKEDIDILTTRFLEIFGDRENIVDAYHFANDAFVRNGITRNDGKETPYIIHPIRMSLFLNSIIEDVSDEMIIATLVHDCDEDCPDVSLEMIRERFGSIVATSVDLLTYFEGSADQQSLDTWINIRDELSKIKAKVPMTLSDLYPVLDTQYDFAKYRAKAYQLYRIYTFSPTNEDEEKSKRIANMVKIADIIDNRHDLPFILPGHQLFHKKNRMVVQLLGLELPFVNTKLLGHHLVRIFQDAIVNEDHLDEPNRPTMNAWAINMFVA